MRTKMVSRCLALAALILPLSALAQVPPLTYNGTITATVSTSSQILIPAGLFQKVLQLCTLPGSSANVWLNPSGGTAVVNQGLPIRANFGCINFGSDILPLPKGPITAITDGGSPQTVSLGGG